MSTLSASYLMFSKYDFRPRSKRTLWEILARLFTRRNAKVYTLFGQGVEFRKPSQPQGIPP